MLDMNSVNLVRQKYRAEFDHICRLPEREQFRGLIDYLRTKHRGRNAVAACVLEGCGPEIEPDLIEAAVRPGLRPQHRVRILDVAERIGTPLDVDHWVLLMAATPHFGAAVREKIARLLLLLRPGGPVFQISEAPPSPQPPVDPCASASATGSGGAGVAAMQKSPGSWC